MIKMFFFSAVRALFKDRIFTLIGLFGLVLGNAAFIVVGSLVFYNLSFDRWAVDHKHIFRLATSEYVNNNLVGNYANTYEGISAELPTVFPEVVASTKFYTFSDDDMMITASLDANEPPVIFSNFSGIVTDSVFLDVFSLEFLRGASEDFRSHTVVITETLARRYFGNNWNSGNRVVGSTLKAFDGDVFDFTIVGVVRDVPKQSHFRFDILFLDPRQPGDFWTGPLYYTYVKLKENALVSAVEKKVNEWLATRNTQELSGNPNRRAEIFFQPLTSIHINSHLEDELSENSNWRILLALAVFALLILAIAWGNFTNLSIARLLSRGKEIYMHRLLGAKPLTLIMRYSIESTIVNTFAILFSLLIIFIGITYARSEFRYADALRSPIATGSMLLFLIIAGTIVSFIIYLLILKNPDKQRSGGKPWKPTLFQRFLIVGQYGISIVLLTVATGVFSQMEYIFGFGIGLQKEGLLVIKSFDWTEEVWSQSTKSFIVSDSHRQKALTFSEEVTQYSFVSTVTTLSHIPGEMPQWGSEFWVEGAEAENIRALRCIGVGYNFASTLGVKLLAGRDFSDASPTDKGNENQGAVLVNLAAVRDLQLGSPEDALHKVIKTDWGARYEVIGVINSYNQLSLRQPIVPLYYRLEPRAMRYYLVRLNRPLTNSELMEIKARWEDTFGRPFEYFFLEDFIESNYSGETAFSRAVASFSGTAILISALGLFAFTTYINAKRKKEIAIRKVLGASAWQVFGVIIRSFFVFILIAMVIGLPVSYYVLKDWQTQFAYKATLSPFVYVGPILLIALITLFSVSYESWKASKMNPIDSIRNE